jgi:hypothetical protein
MHLCGTHNLPGELLRDKSMGCRALEAADVGSVINGAPLHKISCLVVVSVYYGVGISSMVGDRLQYLARNAAISTHHRLTLLAW